MVEEANHWAKGSSPLARGLLTTAENAALGAGIIPARAGFTAMNVFNRPPKKDHPRSRGVYLDEFHGVLVLLGSSPLARGLLLHPLRGVQGEGIIPARAGFTRLPRSGWLGLPDHPRSRGVYEGSISMPGTVWGSSPLARGLLVAVAGDDEEGGIIPARAGFTWSSSC